MLIAIYTYYIKNDNLTTTNPMVLRFFDSKKLGDHLIVVLVSPFHM